MPLALVVTADFVFVLRSVAGSVELADRLVGSASRIGLVLIVGGVAMCRGRMTELSPVADYIEEDKERQACR
jgi:hypothetical protein